MPFSRIRILSVGIVLLVLFLSLLVRTSSAVDVVTNVTTSSSQIYVVKSNGLSTSAVQYIDRPGTFTSIPSSLVNATYIQTANDDKVSSDDDFLSFSLSQQATVYVALDDRVSPRPTWMSTYTDTGENITSAYGTFSVYSKDASAGTVVLGGNTQSGIGNVSMYSVVVTTQGGSSSCTPREDVNCDGIVDFSDLSLVLSSFGKTGPNPSDVTGDNVVNIQDLAAVLSAYGTRDMTPTPGTTTPTPTTGGQLSPTPTKVTTPTPTSVPGANDVTVTNIQVASVNGSEYSIGPDLFFAKPIYDAAPTPSSSTFTTIPPFLLNATYILTTGADRTNRTVSDFLTFNVNKPTTVYVGHDDLNTPPTWLTSGFTNTGWFVATQKTTYSLYKKDFPTGKVSLGGNFGASPNSMYTVILMPAGHALTMSNPWLGNHPIPSVSAINAGIPPCTTHDVNKWHGLYDPVRNCHYDHMHNHNPHDLNDIFGPPSKNWGGQEISYPWQTFDGAGDGHPRSPGVGSGKMENEIKHEGYKYIGQRFTTCTTDDLDGNIQDNQRSYNEHNCIKAWRAQIHTVGGAVDAVVRVHSYYNEYQICPVGSNNCGIIRHGGWADFGILEVPYKKLHVKLPSDPPNAEEFFPGGPYRAHSTLEQADNSINPTKPGRFGWRILRYLWLGSSSHSDYHRYVKVIFKSLDDVSGLDTNDPFTNHFICGDSKLRCPFNHSTQHITQAHAEVPYSFDTDGDGRVTGLFWTDRYGELKPSCTGPSLDCVPLEYVNAPVGWASRANQIVNTNLTTFPDYDVSPAGLGVGSEWWIEYPN